MSTFISSSPIEILQQSKSRPITQNSAVAHVEELKRFPKEYDANKYLYTCYCYEVENELTELEYDEWVEQKTTKSAAAKGFMKTFKIIEPKKDVIELVPSHHVSIIGNEQNYVARIPLPYGYFPYKDVEKKIADLATYNTHLLTSNDQSFDIALGLISTGKVNELTHVAYGTDKDYALYASVAHALWRKVVEERHGIAMRSERTATIAGVKVLSKTYVRI